MDTKKAHCNRCLGKRNHEILTSHKEDWHDDEHGFDATEQYELLKCLGCERITCCHTSWWSEDYDPETGDAIPTIRYYPPAISRSEPNWMYDLLKIEGLDYIHELLREIYVGLQNGLTRLATMGIRALLETIMIQKVGDNGRFDQNLNKFQLEGYVSKNEKNIIDSILEAGHASIHRSYSPKEEDLITCMDIAETLIESIYIHPIRAGELNENIPKRKK